MVTADRQARQESISDAIRRLQTYVARFERRYECSSEVMAQATLIGLVKETAEISKWLMNYRVLQNLKEHVGRTTGIPSTTT